MTNRPASRRAAPSAVSARRAWRLIPMLAAILGILWLAGLLWFAETMPSELADPDTPTDAIVVLTGGSQRLAAGLDLMAAGRARKLFVSGVHHGVAIGDLLRVTHAVPASVVACCIVLGHDADSTIGNALETAVWMHKEGYASLRLVTASYHMRRSLFEFERAMPGIRMIAHPVFPERVKLTHWWESRSTAGLVVGEYHKYLGALLRAALALPSGAPEPPDESGAA
jgi:uncharacterized SAM-binding protein YcdF (DUF218 family)